MNGIAKITKEIASEAEAEITSVLTEAEAQASALTEEFAAKAKAAEEELMRAGREAAEQRVQLVSAAYDKAKKALLGLDEDKYVAFLAGQACAAALTGSEEVILSQADRSRLGEKLVSAANAALKERGLPGELRLSDETRPISGGLVLRRGSIEVNCTLDKLLEMSRGSLDAEVASVLFG